MFDDVNPHIIELIETRNADIFFSKYYCYIVNNSLKYVPLSKPLSSLLLKKLGDKLFQHIKHKKSPFSTEINIQPLSGEEMDA